MFSILGSLFAQRAGLLAILAIITLGVTACSILRRGSNASTLGSESSLAGQATLVCSQECSDRGQCGTAEQGPMVLLNSSGPATSGQDMAVSDNTTVTIDHDEAFTAVQVSNNEPMRVIYYMVNVPERGPAWVAGWCIAQ